MSATNRGAVRRAADFYATPLETVYSFLDVYGGSGFFFDKAPDLRRYFDRRYGGGGAS